MSLTESDQVRTEPASAQDQRNRPATGWRVILRLAALSAIPVVIGLAWGAPSFLRSLSEKRAISAVHERGGRYGRMTFASASDVFRYTVWFDGVPLTDDDLTLLVDLPKVERLVLNDVGISDAGLAQVARLNELTDLHLLSVAVTDAGLAHLSTLSSLTALELTGTGVTGPGLSHLTSLRSLRSLTIRAPKPTTEERFAPGDQLIHHVSRLRGLRSLDLRCSAVSYQGLGEFAPLTNLERLRLRFGSLFFRPTGGGWTSLEHMTRLRELAISGVVNDDALASVAALEKLEVLELASFSGTDDGLKHLAALQRLKRFSMNPSASSVTPEAYAALREQLPHTTLDADWWFRPGGPYWSKPSVVRERILNGPAPDFTLDRLRGGDVSLSDYRGQAVVVLYFWATWCGPCIKAMPALIEVTSAFRDRGVVFHAITYMDGPSEQGRIEPIKDVDALGRHVQTFVTERGWNFSVLLNAESGIGNAYGVEGIPQTVVIDRNGTVRSIHHPGAVGFKARLTSELDELTALRGSSRPAEDGAVSSR
jgi:peroxiredoxin